MIKDAKGDKMKGTRTILVIITLLIAMMSASAYTRGSVNNTLALYANEGYLLKAVMLNQDPDPAEPGKYVELRFKVQNEGGGPTPEDVTFELVPEYPFSFSNSADRFKEAGILKSRQMDETGLILYYKLKVDENAVEGRNQVKLRFNIKGDPNWYEFEEFDVRVQTIDAAVIVESVKTEPEMLIPGEKAKLTIKLKNLADSYMKDVSLKLDLTLASLSGNTAAASAGADSDSLIPFAPLNSATEKRVRYIKPGEEIAFEYQIMPYPNAESRVYKIPIQVVYYDELNKEYIKNDIIGVYVGAKPDMYAVIESTEITQANKQGVISIKFVNKGLSDIKFVDVTLKESEDYEITSPSKVYVGNIDSDDYESSEFDIKLKDGKDSVPVMISVTYKDANNKEYSEDITLDLKVVSPPAKQGPGGLTIVIIVVILMGIAWFVYKRWEKKRNVKKK